MQHEKTVQPSKEERAQTEPYQKTKDIAEKELNQQVVNQTNANPSLQNQGTDMEATKSDTEKALAADDDSKGDAGETDTTLSKKGQTTPATAKQATPTGSKTKSK